MINERKASNPFPFPLYKKVIPYYCAFYTVFNGCPLSLSACQQRFGLILIVSLFIHQLLTDAVYDVITPASVAQFASLALSPLPEKESPRLTALSSRQYCVVQLSVAEQCQAKVMSSTLQ